MTSKDKTGRKHWTWKDFVFLFGTSAPFHYRDRQLDLFEHDYNCGTKTSLMTERALELSIADFWLKQHEQEDVVEVGAVTPYYWEHRIRTIIDPGDEHPAVTHRTSMFDFDFTDKVVLSISTIEHIGTGEYNLASLQAEDCVAALNRLVGQARHCLITFPTGCNATLDAYAMSQPFKTLKASLPLYVTVYKRHPFGNRFKNYKGENISIPYGMLSGRYGTANGVVVIEK